MRINEIVLYREIPPSYDSYSKEGGIEKAWYKIQSHLNAEIPSFKFPIPLKTFHYDKDIIIFGFENDTPVLLFFLESFNDGLMVVDIQIKPSLQGRKLSIQLYEKVSKYFQVPIYSGPNQTFDSRNKIWRILFEKYPVNVVGYDQKLNMDLPITLTHGLFVVNIKQPIYSIPKYKNPLKNDFNTNLRTRLLKLLPIQHIR